MRSIKLPSWIDGLLGREPIPAPPHVFAIDDGELRYGGFSSGGQGFELESSFAQELPPESFMNGMLGGPLRDPQAFGEEVRRFITGLPGQIEEASLLVPDTWLRLTFTELAELPRKTADRQEVLRFKLKRLVPFRVEDLRISATEVTALPSQEDPVRLMIGFAIETLMSQLEDAFAAAGVEIGRITNHTLALLAGLEPKLAADELAALVMVQDDAFTLSCMRAGEPLLYRYKAVGDLGGAALVQAVHRDLRMTSGYMAQNFPDLTLGRVFLAADSEVEHQWLSWLDAELSASAEALSFEHFPIARTQPGTPWVLAGPMLGAACLEVH